MNTNTEINTLSTDPVEISRRLQEPFASNEVKFRIGARTQAKDKGLALAYIDARNVQNRLDDVVGCAAWKQEFIELAGTVKCRISILIGGQWISKEDVSAVEVVPNEDGKKNDAADMARKGEHSDAFKRAAVMWGIGRYLYGYNSGWLELKSNGNSFAQAPRLPEHMLPISERKANMKSPTPIRQAAPAQESVPVSAPAPQAPVQEKASAPAAQGVDHATAVEVLGEDFNALDEKQKSVVCVMIDRIMKKQNLPGVKAYLTTGAGAGLPVAAALLRGLEKSQAAA